AFLYVADVMDEMNQVERSIEGDEALLEQEDEAGLPPLPPIEDLLTEGQELLVQISKEPISTKGARITSHISLPGRHLVYMPTVDHIGISRRIESEEERERLRQIVDSMRAPGTGFIVRTVSEGKSEDDLRHDMEFLVGLWENLSRGIDEISAPSLIHSDLDVTSKVLRDILTEDVKRIVVDNVEEYDKIVRFLRTFMPRLNYCIELYKGDEPVFDAYGLEVEISRSLGRKVWLKSGGSIIIEQTEALVAIDVNTGRYVGKHNLEDTILKTNLEALKEIAFQLRLRNIGGIIIIDFIDMDKEAHREKVYTSLEDALKADKNKTNILKISELGLVEMTRKRVRESIGRTLCEPCRYCEGRGYVKGKLTIIYEILRELHREMSGLAAGHVTLLAHPEITGLLIDEERCGVDELEQRYGRTVSINSRPGFHIEQFEIAVG
ncbi:MAG: Rne/Rng family ribonuclease, partial [Desulfuromusa sp.]|nr:Rne/Rng family ribonuclease [Desulfuromusa sp.]